MKPFSLPRSFLLLTACLLTAVLAAPVARAADAAASPAAATDSAAATDNKADLVDRKPAVGAATDSAAATDNKAAPAPEKAAPKAAPKAASKAGQGKPAAKADGKAAPAQSKAAPAAGRKTASIPASPAVQNSDEVLHKKLEEFGREAIEKMNKHALPSLGKKEVKKNADGSYTARYVAIDPGSLRVSFKKAEPAGVVSHIGYLHYVEREYFCTAATEDAAKNGHFEPKINKGQTELIKYVRGKWSY
jgi:hypothetical protein